MPSRTVPWLVIFAAVVNGLRPVVVIIFFVRGAGLGGLGDHGQRLVGLARGATPRRGVDRSSGV